MRFPRPFLLLPLLVACASGGNDESVGVTVHTRTPVSAYTNASGTDATWAAMLNAAGQWEQLQPDASRPGTYLAHPPDNVPTWTVAFACAGDGNSLVAVYQRPRSIITLDVELESQCGPAETITFDLTGTFAHLPLTTSWLDFGYALDDRGFVLPANGDSAEYELLSIFQGTWDLGFGLRDAGGGALRRIVLLRNQAIQDTTKLDIDVGATGVDPIQKPFVVNGIGVDENFSAVGHYALGGGIHGIDIGPQDVPHGQATANLTYETVPPAAAAPGDVHRLTVQAADADKERATTWRVAEAKFHTAMDVTIDLPAGLDLPRAELASPDPYIRVDVIMPTRPNAATYEAVTLGRVSNREIHAWRISVDAATLTGPEARLSIPDLSAAPGFDKAWAIPPGLEREITATVYEAPIPLGDGTIARWSSHATVMAP